MKEMISGFRSVCALFTVRRIDTVSVAPDPALFALFGALAGTFLAISGFSLEVRFPGFAGAAAGALILPFIYETVTGWRGLHALTSALEMRLSGKKASDALTSAEIPRKTYRVTAMMTGIYLLRMTCFGALIFHHASAFLVLAFTGDYFIRGRIAGESFDSAKPLFESDRMKRDWIIPSIISCTAAILNFSFAGLRIFAVIFCMTAFLSYGINRLLSPLGCAVNMRTANVIGYAAGTFLLLLETSLAG